jgi:hypothetical protein
VDAMSDAIEGADVMLYGVSLAYKESANVSVLRALSRLAVCPCVARHASALMVTLSCALQCRMVRVGRAANFTRSSVQLSLLLTHTFLPCAYTSGSQLCSSARARYDTVDDAEGLLTQRVSSLDHARNWSLCSVFVPFTIASVRQAVARAGRSLADSSTMFVLMAIAGGWVSS